MLSRFPRGQRFTKRLGDLDAHTSARRVISESPSFDFTRSRWRSGAPRAAADVAYGAPGRTRTPISNAACWTGPSRSAERAPLPARRDGKSWSGREGQRRHNVASSADPRHERPEPRPPGLGDCLGGQRRTGTTTRDVRSPLTSRSGSSRRTAAPPPRSPPSDACVPPPPPGRRRCGTWRRCRSPHRAWPGP